MIFRSVVNGQIPGWNLPSFSGGVNFIDSFNDSFFQFTTTRLTNIQQQPPTFGSPTPIPTVEYTRT
jgi:hypothetical protein